MSKSAWSTSPETYITASDPIAITGGGGSDIYNNALPTPADLGGIPMGTTFTDQTMSDMWTALLYSYTDPTFDSFDISGQATPLEVGDSTYEDPVFEWSITTPENVNASCIYIDDLTGSANIISDGDITPPAYGTYSPITKTTATTNAFRITGTNTKSEPFTRDWTVTWQWRRYYGETATTPLNATAIKALRVSGLTSGFAGTYAFVAGANKYKYLSYPSALGTATTFKDASTNLDVPFQTVYTVSVTNAFGVTTNYNVHRSTNKIGGAINIVVS